jgi:CRP/FNR family transcriptional regulator, cyclic AMP receptor protein
MANIKSGQKKSTALLSFDSFFVQFSPKTIKKRSNILNIGEIPNEVYYLKKGFARAYAVSSDGQELTMVIFQPGDFFPLISTIKPQRMEYYTESITEVDLIAVPRVQFIEFLYSRQDLLTDMAMRLTARFEGVLTRMEYLVFGTASQKLASMILILADRFGEKTEGKIHIKAPLTHKDLASLVGITRETTTLILSEFTKKGIMSLKSKQIIINNLNALKRNSLVDS